MIKVESVTVTMTMTGEDYRDLCDYMDFAKKHREEQNPVDREEDGGADHAEEMPEESEAPAEQEEAQEADTDPEEDPDDEEDEDDEEDDGPGDLDEAVKKILALSKKHPYWDTAAAEKMAADGEPWTNIAVEIGVPYESVRRYLSDHGFKPRRGRKSKK